MSLSEQGSSGKNAAGYNALFGENAPQPNDLSKLRLSEDELIDDVDADIDGNIDTDVDTDIDTELDSDGDSEGDSAIGNGIAAELKRKKRLISPGALVVYLLKGYIDREDDRLVFESIVQQQAAVSEQCRRLFLSLIIDQEAGYAYVRSLPDEEIPSDMGQRPPQLLSKRPLPFYASFMLILLRQRLVEFEQSGQFGRLVLERSELISLVKTFLHNVNNDKRLDDNLNKAIEDLCSLGLLLKLKGNTKDTKHERIEVKRIISVLVTGDTLAQADAILDSYVKHIQDGGRKKNRISDDA